MRNTNAQSVVVTDLAQRGGNDRMALADQFRTYAQDCLAKAKEAATIGDRVYWLGMAQFWMRLAQYAERNAAGPTAPEENGNGNEDTDGYEDTEPKY
jgi:hypothetical protein